jgi:hypothetical protein
MLKNTVELHVGRLLEIRSDGGFRSQKDVDDLFAAYADVLWNLPADAQHVTIVDQRHCPIMSPDAASYLSERMASANARTVRNATVAPVDSPTAALQYTRVVRNAGLEVRRLFSSESAAIGWLSEVLTPEERARLIHFLDSGARVPEVLGSIKKSLRAVARVPSRR